MEDLISINEAKLDRLVLDIGDHLEKVNNILNQVNDLILESENYFSSPINQKMISIYSDMKYNLDNFKYNISTYSADLIKAKIHFKNKASDIAAEIKTNISVIPYEPK